MELDTLAFNFKFIDNNCSFVEREMFLISACKSNRKG